MKCLGAASLALLGSLVLTTNASPAIVWNDEGDCWPTPERYTYPPEVNLRIYDDDWAIYTKKYRWREAGKGRGYWRGGAWVGF